MPMDRHEKNMERIRRLRLMDDDFMTQVFQDDPECTRVMLSIILEQPDLQVVEVKTQHVINSLEGHSARLDIVARDAEGRILNV